jgi:nickel/cobalt transporter (NicO) family protein
MIMIAYDSSVTVALIEITVLSIKVYRRFQNKLIYYSKYLPKVSSVLIAFMAIGFVIGTL